MTMQFDLKHDNEKCTFIVRRLEATDGKQLIIKDLELEDPELLFRNSIESEIKRRVMEFFDCNNVTLEIDEDTKLKISCVLKCNKEAFEAE